MLTRRFQSKQACCFAINMFQSVGATEWIIIALIVLLLFGGKKIPEFFKGLGESIKEFKRASKEDSDQKEE